MAEHVGHVRISLSGTPVEKKLADLHCQLNQILPGSLSNSRLEFQHSRCVVGFDLARLLPCEAVEQSLPTCAGLCHTLEKEVAMMRVKAWCVGDSESAAQKVLSDQNVFGDSESEEST